VSRRDAPPHRDGLSAEKKKRGRWPRESAEVVGARAIPLGVSRAYLPLHILRQSVSQRESDGSGTNRTAGWLARPVSAKTRREDWMCEAQDVETLRRHGAALGHIEVNAHGVERLRCVDRYGGGAALCPLPRSLANMRRELRSSPLGEGSDHRQEVQNAGLATPEQRGG